MSSQLGAPDTRVDGAAASSIDPTAEGASHDLRVDTLPEVREPQSPQAEADTQSGRRILNIPGTSASAPQKSTVFAQGQIDTPRAPKHPETSSAKTVDSTHAEQKEGLPPHSKQGLLDSANEETCEPDSPAQQHPDPPSEQAPEQASEISPQQNSGQSPKQPPENPPKHSVEQFSEPPRDRSPETSISVLNIQIHKPSDASFTMAKALGTGVVKSASGSPKTAPEAAPPATGAVSQAQENTLPSAETPATPLPTPAAPTMSEVPAITVSDAAVPAQDVPVLAPGVSAGRVKRRKRFTKKVRRAFLSPGLLRILLGSENAALVGKQRNVAATISDPAPIHTPGPL